MDISFNLRKLRRSIAGLTLLALLATMSFVGVAKAQTFSDVDSSDWFYEYVEDLVGQEVLSGYDDGTFGPGDNLTREQAAKMMVLAFIGETDADYDAGFSDVEAGAWYAEYVNTAAMYGIVEGYTDEEGDATGEFGVGDDITRAAFAKMVVNAGGLETNTDGGPHFSDVDEGAWYYDYVETAYNWSVIDGYDGGTFGPGNNVNRAEASKMVVNGQTPEARVVEGDDDDDTEECAEGYTLNDEEVCVDENGCEAGFTWDTDDEVCEEEVVVVPESTGTLQVAMGDAVAGATVPKGATSVEMLNLTFTAVGDAMELDGVTLHRSGVGSSSDFSFVYLYDGDTRLTTGKSIASDDNEVSFGSLNVDLAANESKTITVVVDFATGATTGDENLLEVVGADKIESNASEVSGTFGIVGNVFTIAGASAGTITVAKHGSVPNPTIGESEAEIGEFQLTAASEDQAVTRISLVFKGTINAETALTNLKLWQGGEVVATADSVNSDDLATFVVDGTFDCENYGYTGDGFCLGKGNSRTFLVTADIGVTADPSDTIIVYLDESTDLESLGLVYGYGAQVTYTSYDYSVTGSATTDASYSTVQGGQFTMSQDGPNPGDIAINAKDVILSKMTFTSERNVEVRQLQATLKATSGSGLVSDDDAVANFTDIKIVRLDEDDNIVETLMGPQELTLTGNDTAAAGQTVTFTDSWTMSEDEEAIVAITCDVANYASLDSTPLAADLVAISTSAGIRDTDTNEYITDIVPSVAVTGNTMTIKAASLAVSLASYPTSDTYVKGTDDVQLAAFAMSAGDAMDLTVNSIVVAGYLDEDQDGGGDEYEQAEDNDVDIKNVVPNLWITDEAGDQLGSTQSFSSGDATFSSLAWTIPAGTTEVLRVYGNISDSAFFNSDNDYVAVSIDDVSADMSVEDEEGNTVTATGDTVNGDIEGTDAPNVAATITGGGTLTFAYASDAPVGNQIVAQQEDEVLVGRYKLTATDENFEVSKLTFSTTNSAGAGSSASGLKDNVETLTLKYPTDVDASSTLDGSLELTMAGTNVKFSGLGLMVPKDDAVYVELYADFAPHNLNNGGLDSDDAIYFNLNAGDGDGEAYGDLEATGQGSGTGYAEDEVSDVTTANVTYVYRTIPTVAHDTSLPTSLTTGSNVEVYRFSITAGSYEDVTVRFMTFDVTSDGLRTGNNANSLTHATADDATWTSDLCETAGGYTGGTEYAFWVKQYDQDEVIGTGCYNSYSGYVLMNLNQSSEDTLNSGLVVAEGTTKVLSLFTRVYNDDSTSTTSESISVKPHKDTTHVDADTVPQLIGDELGGVDTTGATGMIWSDKGLASHWEGTADWYVGYKVPGMPTTFMTLSK